jgi:hypothetical protein
MRNDIPNKNSGHDRRFIDLAGVLSLLLLVTATYAVVDLDKPTPKFTSMIVPSQTVRW